MKCWNIDAKCSLSTRIMVWKRQWCDATLSQILAVKLKWTNFTPRQRLTTNSSVAASRVQFYWKGLVVNFDLPGDAGRIGSNKLSYNLINGYWNCKKWRCTYCSLYMKYLAPYPLLCASVFNMAEFVLFKCQIVYSPLVPESILRMI